jgi:hypothetical protein
MDDLNKEMLELVKGYLCSKESPIKNDLRLREVADRLNVPISLIRKNFNERLEKIFSFCY